MNVEKLLQKKPDSICHIRPDASVFEALQQMERENTGSILVIQDDKLVGIMTERDYARKVILKGRFSRDTRVSDVMTTDVLFVTLDRKADECLALMSLKRVRYLPVIENNKVLGMISIGDVVDNIISEQEHKIKDYENYIRGWY